MKITCITRIFYAPSSSNRFWNQSPKALHSDAIKATTAIHLKYSQFKDGDFFFGGEVIKSDSYSETMLFKTEQQETTFRKLKVVSLIKSCYLLYL